MKTTALTASTIPFNPTGTPCAHFTGKVDVNGVHVAAFAVDGAPVPLSMAEIFERTRSFLACVDGTHYLVSLNWLNLVQVLGPGELSEAVLNATVMHAVSVSRCIDPRAPLSFRVAVMLMFALDWSEADVRREIFRLATVEQMSQQGEMPDVGSIIANA